MLRAEPAVLEGVGPCLRIANGDAELLVTTAIGPRIISYALRGGPNAMFVNRSGVNRKGGPDFDRTFYRGATWDVFGGTRVWVAPESMPETFYPDREPVEVAQRADGARFVAPVQAANGVQLALDVSLAPEGSRVSVVASVTNRSGGARRIAPWILNVLDAGGFAVLPQTHVPSGVLPNRTIALWDYTEMRDPRIFWGSRYITLRQDPEIVPQVKLATSNAEGWSCYLNRGLCFVSRFAYDADGVYADRGVNCEAFTNGWYMELESMAPLVDLPPGETAFHREEWELLAVAATPAPDDESAIDAFAFRYLTPVSSERRANP